MDELKGTQPPVRPSGMIDCTRLPQHYRITGPDDRIQWIIEDRHSGRTPARCGIPDVIDGLFRVPRDLRTLIHDTIEQLTAQKDLAERQRTLKDFTAALNEVTGYFTSYPPIPIYRFSEEELRQAMEQQIRWAGRHGPCNPQANVRMMVYYGILETLEARKRPQIKKPGYLLA